jgi:hypothetical protein
MTVNEMIEGFKHLSKAERNQFLERARDINTQLGLSGLRAGMKVQFKESRSGVMITGTLVRMKRVKAEVESNQGKYGLPLGYKVKWSVSPSMLTAAE